ncbi:MAG: S8 family serine peptidase [Bdellovibrionales bacterium]|nr:S8 family serine peptidase [Bdellovibrionales bacterium]
MAKGKKRAVAAAAVGLAAGVGLAFWWGTRPAESILVAVVDTGVDAADPSLKGRVLAEGAWNFFDSNADFKDEDGHGTEVARRVLAACPVCRVLPLKVTKRGAGVRAKDLEGAFAKALEAGARVVNVSLGVESPVTPELKAAAEKLDAAGVLLVAAAGTGAPNPFKSVLLSKMIPQSLPQTLVVGVAPAADRAETVQNTGPELAFCVVHAIGDGKRGSSYAAAEVSGWAACRLARSGRWDPESLKEAVLKFAKPVADAEPGRLGAGTVDPAELLAGAGDCPALAAQ